MYSFACIGVRCRGQVCHGSQLKVVGSFQELTLTVLKLPSRILRSSGQCVCLMWCLPPLCVCGFVFELLPKLSKQVTIPATARSDSTTAPQACWFLVLRFLLFCFLCLFSPTPEWGGGAWPQQPSSAVGCGSISAFLCGTEVVHLTVYSEEYRRMEGRHITFPRMKCFVT